MGVMNCARRGCGSILCDRSSHDFGYLCNDCFDELVKSGPTTDIAKFMLDERTANNLIREARARYEAEFPRDE